MGYRHSSAMQLEDKDNEKRPVTVRANFEFKLVGTGAKGVMGCAGGNCIGLVGVEDKWAVATQISYDTEAEGFGQNEDTRVVTPI
jgi:hypothetical protein